MCLCWRKFITVGMGFESLCPSPAQRGGKKPLPGYLQKSSLLPGCLWIRCASGLFQCCAREMLVIPKTHTQGPIWCNSQQGLYSIQAISLPPNTSPSCRTVLVVVEPQISIGARLYSKQQVGDKYALYCGLYHIDWWWESYHKLDFCFRLHWSSLDRSGACNMGVQVC